MKNILLILMVLLLPVFSYSKEVKGVGAPPCVGTEVKSPEDAKCIALFYGQFLSVIGAFGEDWDVEAKLKGENWYIYPKKPNGIAPEGTVLYIINKITGKPISGYKPKI